MSTSDPQTTPTIHLLNTLSEAGKQFRFYEKQHLSKQPPDHAKAQVNADWAEKCESSVKSYMEAINGI